MQVHAMRAAAEDLKEDLVEGGDVLLQPLNMQAINAPGGPSAPSSTPSVGAVAAPPPPPPSASADHRM
jgi:hypothetical protein